MAIEYKPSAAAVKSQPSQEIASKAAKAEETPSKENNKGKYSFTKNEYLMFR